VVILHGYRPDHQISLLIGFYVLVLFGSDFSYSSHVADLARFLPNFLTHASHSSFDLISVLLT